MSSIEDLVSYEGQTHCDPTPKPGAMAFRDHVLKHFGGTDLGIVRECHIGGKSEHKEGRAWDWGFPKGYDVSGFLDWLLRNSAENARRAGIMYFIYERRAWRAYKEPHWSPYTGKDPHDTHIHISFSKKGGDGLTSIYAPGALEASMIDTSSGKVLPFIAGATIGFLAVRYAIVSL